MRLDPTEAREELDPRRFTLEQIAQAVEGAIVKLKFCAPSGDFYARPDEWRTDTVYTIDPHSFMRALREM